MPCFLSPSPLLTLFGHERECLAPLLISKFSRVLIPHLPPLSSRPNTPTPSLLLACSGGSSSISLLEMFHRTFCVSASSKSRTGRARWGRIVVGFVDFGHEEKERAKERLRGIKELAEKFEWEFWRVGVEEAFDQTGELLSEDARLDGRVGINVSPGRGKLFGVLLFAPKTIRSNDRLSLMFSSRNHIPTYFLILPNSALPPPNLISPFPSLPHSFIPSEPNGSLPLKRPFAYSQPSTSPHWPDLYPICLSGSFCACLGKRILPSFVGF